MPLPFPSDIVCFTIATIFTLPALQTHTSLPLQQRLYISEIHLRMERLHGNYITLWQWDKTGDIWVYCILEAVYEMQLLASTSDHNLTLYIKLLVEEIALYIIL